KRREQSRKPLAQAAAVIDGEMAVRIEPVRGYQEVDASLHASLALPRVISQAGDPPRCVRRGAEELSRRSLFREAPGSRELREAGPEALADRWIGPGPEANSVTLDWR